MSPLKTLPVLASMLMLLAGCGSQASAPASTVASPVSTPASAKPSTAPSTPASAKPSASASSAAAGEKVRGAWVAIAATQAPVWAGIEGGFYPQNGLNPELSLIQGSANASAALLSSNVDIVQMSGPGVVNAGSQGVDLVFIAGFVQIAIYKLMADPSIKTLDDLKGKTIAVSQIGGQDDFIIRKALKLKGFNSETDFKYTQTRSIPASVAALSAKQVQAAVLSAPEHVPAIQAGAKELLDITGMQIPFQATGLVTTKTYLKSHRGAALNFLKATVQGIRKMKGDERFTNSVMSKYLKTEDADTLKSAYQVIQDGVDYKARPSIPGLQEVLDENNVTNHRPEEFIDSSLVDELEAAGFFR